MESTMMKRMTIVLALAAAGCGSQLLSLGPTDGGVSLTDAGVVTNGAWVNVTGNLALKPSECGNLSYLSARPDADLIIASVALHGLWALSPSSATWSPLGQGSGSAVITNRASSIVYDYPANPGTWYESGIYNGGAVYKTIDSGATWTQLGNIMHSDSVGIDFKDPYRKTLLAGGHEQITTLYRSTDSGATWTNIGANIPAGAGYSSNVVVIDFQTYLLGTYSGTNSGVFLTVDGGVNWSKVYSGGVVRSPLFAVFDHSIYWLLENSAGVIRSTDNGAHWTPTVGAGAVSTSSGGSLVEIAGGRIIAIGADHLVMSSDHGSTWRPFATLPYAPVGVVYSHLGKAFYIWHFTCALTGDPVPPDAIERLNFDELTQ
jgi:hypothetical protein